jgi:hypothetical protein
MSFSEKIKKTSAEKAYSLLEAVADIAYVAGAQKYYSGDSRTDLANYIRWGKEFESIWKNEVWGDGEADYMTEIEQFAMDKMLKILAPVKQSTPKNKPSFFTCRLCADALDLGPWPACATCHGTGRVTLFEAIDQALGISWRWWRLTKLSYRILGKCSVSKCWRRPQWRMAQAGSRDLACDKHVTRGCCWPNGTTVCADWERLPLFTGDEGRSQ